MNFLRQSTAVDIAIGPFIDDDGITPATGLSITQAECRLKKNNGAWAQANDNTTATHEEEGWYEKELDATDTNTCGILIVAVYISGNLAYWKEFQVVEEAVYDMFFAASATGIIGTAQTGDSFARLGAPAGASIAADIAAIEAQTDDIGAAGAGLTAIPWNAAWDAEVQSEVADALAVYDPPTNAEMVARTLASADYATATNLATVDTVVDAIQAKTDNLPTDPADQSLIIAATNSITADIAALDGKIDTIDGNVDAILVDTGTTLDAAVSGIKAVTDALPDAGALTSLATAANLATVDTVVDAIKAKTDSLTFTVAGQVDANIQSINDVTITGDGQVGTEFGV